MKILPLLILLCATFAHAQMPEIKIGRCAGQNPILIWGGGGPDFGEFRLVVGDGPCDGVIFEINHGLSGSVSRVTTWNTVRGIPEKRQSKDNDYMEGTISTVGNFNGLKRGDVIQARYIITRKKTPKA